MIHDNSRLAMDLYPASAAVREIDAIYRMGVAVGLDEANATQDVASPRSTGAKLSARPSPPENTAGQRRPGRFEGVVAIAGLAVVWQIASYFFPNYLFPTVPAIAGRFIEIFSSLDTTLDALATGGRILAGLAGAFVLGGVLAALMARSATFERYVYPLMSFNQGIPALSWVVIVDHLVQVASNSASSSSW